MLCAVVLLMASACPEAPADSPTRCVMDVIICADREQAARIVASVPGWTSPHVLPLSEAADFDPGP